MKTYKIVAGVVATLLTFASLSAVDYNVDVQPRINADHAAIKVTDLAPVIVHPSAAERRAAALTSDTRHGSLATMSAGSNDRGEFADRQFNLLGSQLVMPYYSFGKKFGGITKE